MRGVLVKGMDSLELTASASNVADIKMNLIFGFGAALPNNFLITMSKKSISLLRSCTSSMTMWVKCPKSWDWIKRSRRRPVVQYRMRVSSVKWARWSSPICTDINYFVHAPNDQYILSVPARMRDWHSLKLWKILTWYPTIVPGTQLRSVATRIALLTAAMRRGCVTTIEQYFFLKQASSNINWGTYMAQNPSRFRIFGSFYNKRQLTCVVLPEPVAAWMTIAVFISIASKIIVSYRIIGRSQSAIVRMLKL